MLLMIHPLFQALVIFIYFLGIVSGVGALTVLRRHAPYRASDTLCVVCDYIWHLLTFRAWDGDGVARLPNIFFFVTVLSTIASLYMFCLNIESLVHEMGKDLGLTTSLRWLAAHFAASVATVGFHAGVRAMAVNLP